MNTKRQQMIAASILNQMTDARLGLITVDQWIERYDAAEAEGVEHFLACRTRRGALRGVANAQAADELCDICGNPVDDGDEPGHGFYDNGAEAPLCSVACTEAFYGADQEV